MDDTNLIILDFGQDDTIELLEELLDKARSGKISGMVFSVHLNSKRRRRIILGATGRSAHNLLEATGLSALLHCRLTNVAMDHLQAHE